MQPISDFYCKPQSEEEAREIVERAVAHGAEPVEVICHGGIKGKACYGWYVRDSWGVVNGKTRVDWDTMFVSADIPELTLDQLRERAPLVGELSHNAKAWAAFDKNQTASGMAEHEWQAARRALYFAGMLTNDERSESVNEKGKDLVDVEIGDSGYKVTGIITDLPSETDEGEENNLRGAGLKFDGGKPKMRLLPPVAMLEMAKVMTFGAEKYKENSWRQVEGAKERYLDALGRHYNAWCRGELNDEESGLSHMAHIMCNAAFLLELEGESDR